MSPGAAAMPATGMVTIEEARREDLPAIVEILALETMFGVRDSVDPAHFADYEQAFEAIAGDPRTTLYVARVGSRVLGTFQLLLMRALTRHGAVLAIAEAVQVHPDARGQGVGSAMMAFAAKEAKRRGAASLQLTSNKKRFDAHRFYERAGFERRHEGFKMDLDDRA